VKLVVDFEQLRLGEDKASKDEGASVPVSLRNLEKIEIIR